MNEIKQNKEKKQKVTDRRGEGKRNRSRKRL